MNEWFNRLPLCEKMIFIAKNNRMFRRCKMRTKIDPGFFLRFHRNIKGKNKGNGVTEGPA